MYNRGLYTLVLVALCSVAKCSSHFGASGGWRTNDFPNPMTDPLRCGRKDVPRSMVCDPDHLLSKTAQDEIEGHLNFIKTGQVAVAIVKKIDLTESESNVDAASRIFCRALHDSWGVGSVEKNDGVVVFVSVEDRAVYISTGDGSKKLLTAPTIDGIIHRMKPFLRNSDYGGALINSVIEIEMLFSGKFVPLKPNSSDSTGTSSDPITFGLFLCMIFGFGGYAFWQNRKLQRLDRGRIALDNLIREVDNTSKGSEGDKLFITTSCPICLENFPETETDTEGGSTITEDATFTASDSNHTFSGSDQTSETRSLLKNLQPKPSSPVFESKTTPAAKLKPMALRCGHTFCHDCISTYLKSNEGKKCPICRFPVHEDYDNMDPRQPAMRPTPHPSQQGQQGGARPGAGSGGYDDGTSCGRSSAAANAHQESVSDVRGLESVNTEDTARVNQDPMQSDSGYSQESAGFRTRAPEFHYRLNRMRHLYPDIMTMQLLHSMNRAVDRGSLHEMRTELSSRSTEIQHTVTEMRAAAERAARQSGSRGSSSMSFGGGRSSGGGGGRW